MLFTRRHPMSRNRPDIRLSSNFEAGGRDNLASHRSQRRPEERAGRSRDAYVSYSRIRWRRRPQQKRRWKHRRWMRRRMMRKRKPADRYAKPFATATSPTVACRDDGRSPRPPMCRCDDGCSSLSSWQQYCCTPVDKSAVEYRRLTRTSET